MTEVYAPTTAPNPTSSLLTWDYLDKIRFIIKLLQVLMSFVAFILEEVVSSCLSCGPLYFFEFVSCTAFLFTLLLLVLLSTNLHNKVGIGCWAQVDFFYTAIIGVLFLIASIVFAADNNGTTTEQTAVAFGFVASLLFFADLPLFWKNKGSPLPTDKKAAPPNGGPANRDGEAPPEMESLNRTANGTE